MNCQIKTEKEFIESIDIICKKYIKAPVVTVMSRIPASGEITLSRLVKFVCIVDRDNEELVNALIFDGIENDYKFIGSEINLQHDLDVDYLYIEAKIMAIKKES